MANRSRKRPKKSGVKSKAQSKKSPSKTSRNKGMGGASLIGGSLGLRNVLFKPERSSYVRKVKAPAGCVFCAAARAGVGLESLCVLQTEHSMIVVNKFPYNSGHLMVMPKSHVASLLDLGAVEYADLMNLVRKAVQALQTEYEPQGMNLGLNLGEAAGAGIPGHLHYHLVPRWRGDLNFFPLIGQTKVVIEDVAKTFDRVKAYFDRSPKETP